MNTMDVDEGPEITIDFTSLKDDFKQKKTAEQEREFESKLKDIAGELDRLAPNIRPISNLEQIEKQLKATANEFEHSRQEAKSAKEAFQEVKRKRYNRFNKTFSQITQKIDSIYKDLTKSKTFPLGGTAYLSVEDNEEPYLHGIKYHAMPPLKRFREMELLSGGEKTIAALALLFAINSTHPSPFFVLDEVDAALDNTNVARMTEYITNNCKDLQFIVISLKSTFYEHASSLIGIYRDQEMASSGILTLDLCQFKE